MGEVYYSAQEAAYILGISTASVLKAIRSGELEAVWIDRGEDSPAKGYRMTIAMLEEFMHRHQSNYNLAKIGAVLEKRIAYDYLETLEEREDRLYDELTFIEGVKDTLKKLGL